MPSESMLTERGRRALCEVAAWLGWVCGFALLAFSLVFDAVTPRVTGVAVLVATLAWTTRLAIRRRDEVVRAAYDLGRMRSGQDETEDASLRFMR